MLYYERMGVLLLGTHLIPREIDGDARILLVFTPKGFIGTLIGLFAGFMFYQVSAALGAAIVGWIVLFICATIGFVIGQVRIPESNTIPLFRKTGGDYIYAVIAKYFAFKKKRKVYVYEKTDYQENKNKKN